MTEKVTIELIQKRVGERYGLRDRDLKLRSNAKAIAFPRQVAMYLARQLTAASLPEIGRQFGGKHHTTVMHSINKVEGLRRSDKELDRTISCLLDSFEIALSLSSVPTDSVLTPTDSVLTLTDSALTRAEVDSLLRSPHGFIANSNLRKHRFPRLVPSIRAIDLPLPVRVQNCWQHLKKVHGLTELSDLSRFTLGELLHLKNFGRKSLLDLLSAVFPVILDHPESTVGVSTVALPPMDRALSHAEVQDLLRFPDKLTIHDLDLLKRRFPQIAPAVRISDLSLSVRVGNCLRVLKELHAIGAKTLQAIGDVFHLTRERVRQVTSKFRKKVQQVHPFTPTLKRTITHISHRLPATVDDIESEITGWLDSINISIGRCGYRSRNPRHLSSLHY